MASRELQLISRLITRGELTKVIEWGIQADDFRTGMAKSMYEYLVSYYSMPQTRGSVIGLHAATQVFGNFAACDDPHMTTEALCSEVRQERIAHESLEKMDKIREEMASNPLQACMKLMQLGTEMVQLGSGKMTDVKFGPAYDQALRLYEMRKAGVSFAVAQFPWNLLQYATGGMQTDDYIVFYGRPKAYKSWVLFYIASCLFMQDKRIVIYTKEMTPENVYNRIICCIAQVRYQQYREGKLSPTEELAIYQTRRLIYMMGAEDKIIVLSGKDAMKGGDTVPWLQSKIKTYAPDAVFIDGLYLMSDVNKNRDKHTRVQSISNDLRQMNLDTCVPIIATLQANRKAAGHNEANLDELAFSDAIGQDATLIVRVINEKETPTAMLVLAGAREFSLNGLRINASPAVNFEQYGMTDDDARITAKDIEKAKDKDAGENDKDNANGHAKPRASNGLLTTPKQEYGNVNTAITQIPNPFRPLGH